MAISLKIPCGDFSVKPLWQILRKAYAATPFWKPLWRVTLEISGMNFVTFMWSDASLSCARFEFDGEAFFDTILDRVTSCGIRHSDLP